MREKIRKAILRARMRILEEKLQHLAGRLFGEDIVIAYVPVSKLKEKIKDRELHRCNN